MIEKFALVLVGAVLGALATLAWLHRKQVVDKAALVFLAVLAPFVLVYMILVSVLDDLLKEGPAAGLKSAKEGADLLLLIIAFVLQEAWKRVVNLSTLRLAQRS